MRKLLIIFICLLPLVAEGTNYYVSNTGDDANTGGISDPFESIQEAIDNVSAGDTIFLRDGVHTAYYLTYRLAEISNIDGTESNPIVLMSYPGEWAIIDGSLLTPPASHIGIFSEFSDWWEFRNFEVRNVALESESLSYGMRVQDMQHNIFENLIIHTIGGIGMRLQNDFDSCYVINCDAYNCVDTTGAQSGGNADGFELGYTGLGVVNWMNGCRSWNNSDDGYDLWENDGVVYIDSCMAFRNGRYTGDGNGFKLGGITNDGNPAVKRYLQNNIAFDNDNNGFDFNYTDAEFYIYNNTAYRNGNIGFFWGFSRTLTTTLKNNVAYLNTTDYDLTPVLDTSNNSNLYTTTDADFQSVDTTGITADRVNGEIQYTEFLQLDSLSQFINAGVDVGLPYDSTAPDLGAYEYYFSQPDTGYNAYAVALFDRWSHTPSDYRKQVISNVFDTLGVYADSLDVFRIYGISDEDDALLNWIADTFNATNVNGAIFKEDTGFFSDGTGYLNSGFTPTEAIHWTNTRASFGYFKLNNVSETVTYFGARTISPNYRTNFNFNSGNITGYINGAEGTASSLGQDSGIVAYAHNGVAVDVYLDGTLRNSRSTGTVETIQDRDFLEMTQDNNGSIGTRSTEGVGAVVIGKVISEEGQLAISDAIYYYYASLDDPCDTTNVTPTAETTPAPNGTITTTTIGGVEPYTYDWSNDSTTKDLTGLDAGTYSVVVTDANGCTGNGSWTIRSRGVVKFSTGLWIYNGGSVVFE